MCTVKCGAARLNQIFKSILIKFLGIIRGRKDEVGWEANESKNGTPQEEHSRLDGGQEG